MKHLFALVLGLLASSVNLLAQSIVSPNDSLVFSHPIVSMTVSDDGNQALVFSIDSISPTKVKGEMAFYDLKSKTRLYHQACNPFGRARLISADRFQALNNQTSDQSRITRYGALLVDKGKTTLISTNGQKVWQNKLIPAWVDEKNDMVLGYPNPTSNKLMGYRLSDGQQLWKQKVSHKYNLGWNQVTRDGDSLIIVAADDVYFIHVNDGRVDTYKSKNGIERTGSMLLKSIVLGAAVGAVGGMIAGSIGAATGHTYTPQYPYYYTGGTLFPEDIYTNTCSNVFKLNHNYYVTDRNHLSCLDANGQALWTHEFPRKTMGFARVTGKDNRITVVNYAFGLSAGINIKPCGKPFVASFDATTGEQLYLIPLSEEKDYIADGYVSPDTAVLLLGDRIVMQHLADSTHREKPWNTDAYGYLEMLPTDTLYTYRLNDENLTPLHSGSQHWVVSTDKGKIKVVNDELNITDDYLMANTFLKIGRFSNIDLVTNDDGSGEGDYWLVRPDGKPLGKMRTGSKSVALRGPRLYATTGAKLYLYDLTALQKQ